MKLNRLFLGWGAGSLGITALISAQSYLLLFFLVQIVGISPGLAGAVLFAGKLVDILAYPLFGVLSDKTQSRWGRRRPYLFVGAIAGTLAFLMLFSVPDAFGQGAVAAWSTVWLVVLAAAVASYFVPYMAMPAEMTDDPTDRNTIMAYRSTFLMLGTFVGSAASAQLVQVLGGDRQAYLGMAWLLAPLILGSMLWSFFATAKARASVAEAGKLRHMLDLRQIASNRPFLIVTGIKAAQFLGASTQMATILFLITIVMQKPQGYLAYYGATIIAVAVLAMPLWVRIAARIGKTRTFAITLILYTATQMSWLTAGPEEPLSIYLLRSALTGLCSGGMLMSGQSMLIDTMHYDRVLTGQAREGLLSSLYTLAEKVTNALGPLLMGWLLAATGFQAGVFDIAAQPAAAISAIQFGVAWMTLVSTAAMLTLLWFYRLDEGRVRALAAEAG